MPPCQDCPKSEVKESLEDMKVLVYNHYTELKAAQTDLKVGQAENGVKIDGLSKLLTVHIGYQKDRLDGQDTRIGRLIVGVMGSFAIVGGLIAAVLAKL